MTTSSVREWGSGSDVNAMRMPYNPLVDRPIRRSPVFGAISFEDLPRVRMACNVAAVLVRAIGNVSCTSPHTPAMRSIEPREGRRFRLRARRCAPSATRRS